MVVWLRPEFLLTVVTSLYYCSQLVSSKTYDKFWCATEEGHHQLSCPDETALLTDVTIRKIYRRTEMCQPDDHSDYLIHCQGFIDGSLCEGNKTCSIEVSSRNYIQCAGKTYAPTYFYVKYTCTQIHTMCSDTAPIRNTLYGFIVSPAYPHPMADSLKCSINIEADPTMYIELTPIQIRLQDAIKCRSEYLEIFGYLNSLTNNSSYDNAVSSKDSKAIWKSYHTWCGAERSANSPSPNSRYLISSNSLYMSLQTAVSRKPRYFKIRYKVVPSIVRSQYDADGIAYDSAPEASSVVPITTKMILPTTIVMPTVDDKESMKKVNGTVAKRSYKKEIIIGVISGIVLLVIAILAGIGIFLFIKKRRSTAAASKSAASPAASGNVGKKNVSSPALNNNAASKSGVKSSDKAPLLEPATTAAAVPATKRKLVPERTVQISDVNTSRFKSSIGASATTTTATPSGATGKDTPSASSDVAAPSSAPSATKTVLTAADSGIYGADLSDDVPPTTKTMSSIDPPKIYGIDLPDKSEPSSRPSTSSSPPPPAPPVTVLVNPLSETSTPTPTKPEHPIPTTTVRPNNITRNSIPKETDFHLHSMMNAEHFDDTIRSAYSNLIDATMSENEGAIAGSSVVSSVSQSRRTSNTKQPLLSHETNNIESLSRKPTPFNPLHVILKKDANKYYTTEYI